MNNGVSNAMRHIIQCKSYMRRYAVGLQYMYRVYVVHIKCSIFFAMCSKTYETRKFRTKTVFVMTKK